MTVKEKLIACALAALFVLVVLATYAYLVVSGKAEVAPFLAMLTSLVTVAVGLVSGVAGHAAGAGAASTPVATTILPAALVPPTLGTDRVTIQPNAAGASGGGGAAS